MCENPTILKQGAEAKLYVCNYLGKPTLIKERFVKQYRHPDLDSSITKERIKNEARAIVRCKSINVKTPTLYLVDFERRCIYMQYFEHSITVKDLFIKVLSKCHQNSSLDPHILDETTKLIGCTIWKLHENNIIHGDLTTSNMLLLDKDPQSAGNERWLQSNSLELVMIDFGLSFIDSSAEDKAVDLYVLERALTSTHNDYPFLFKKIFEIYKNCGKSKAREIVNKFEEVRARGRKRTMIG